tara:strand:+ start:44736 stop:45503 length:768 start_codon:yes stop_codon:yes gene_type:complete
MKAKKFLKKLISSAIAPVALRVGYRKISLNKLEAKNQLLNYCFVSLKQMGFTPKHIVDVGANKGTWTREAMHYFPDAYYTLIEPQKRLKVHFEDLLVSKKVSYYPVGAGSEKGSFKFTLHERDDSCSFQYSEAAAAKLGYEQVDIPVETLDNLLSQNPAIPSPDLIKIDAEGLDLEVIKGAGSFLGKTEVFLVEVGVCNIYIKNDILTVLNYMDSIGYRMFDVTDLNRPFRPKALWLMELVFVKKGGLLDTYKIT